MTIAEPPSAARPTPNLLHLPDRRRLAWYEFGDPRGRPCIYVTGTPASGLMGLAWHRAAREAGVRWISVDKPGYGHSDFHGGRRFLDWVPDVTVLAEHLRLKRFAVAGESGGGPYALALAHESPRRVTVAVLISAMGPGEADWVRQGMNPQNNKLHRMAQRTPWLLRWSMSRMAGELRDPRRRARFLEQCLDGLPPSDRAGIADAELMQLQVDATLGAFRQGARAAAQEMRLFASDWGFPLAAVAAPVVLWHGTEDSNVPVAVARSMAAALPNCRAHFVDGVGHALARNCAAAIMAAVKCDEVHSALSA